MHFCSQFLEQWQHEAKRETQHMMIGMTGPREQSTVHERKGPLVRDLHKVVLRTKVCRRLLQEGSYRIQPEGLSLEAKIRMNPNRVANR
jgi:hypothetical protein